VNQSLHGLSGAYVVDALDDAERVAFEKHLPGCPDCQQEVASLREATTMMADDAALAPPPALRNAVLSGIKTIRPLPPETDDEPRDSRQRPAASMAKVLPMRPRRRRIAAVLTAAAAVLVVGAGAVFQPWQDDNPPASALSAADQVLAASDAKHVSINFKDGSSATVVHSRSEGRAVLLTQDMALPPAGKAYEVWWQDATGTMIPAGMMKPQPDNKMLLEGEPSKAAGVGITVEPEGGSKAPSSEPIALFDLKADA
jgi:anti-sigma-K factor RskA